jgi:hypothetical protein
VHDASGTVWSSAERQFGANTPGDHPSALSPPFQQGSDLVAEHWVTTSQGLGTLLLPGIALSPVAPILRVGVQSAVRESTKVADYLAAQNLDVYDSRDVIWHPELGEVAMPEGWEFLPSGDVFVTRTVKAAGTYWTLWRPRSRGCDHRRKIGLLAPADAIAAARAAAEATVERRAAQRVTGAKQRERSEAAYRTEFVDAVVAWLCFAPEHRALADEIAVGAAEQAAVVGSGRVGRTRTLPLAERAGLAARAFIRHQYTDYEDQLAPVGSLDDEIYRSIKRQAHQAVDEFLERHRS